MEELKRLKNIKVENYVWVIYIGIIILSWYANSIEKDYLINKDKSIFLELPSKIKGRKRDYFSSTDDNIRVPVKLEEVDLYAEVNLSANDIIKNIRRLLNEYKIDEKNVFIYINQ